MKPKTVSRISLKVYNTIEYTPWIPNSIKTILVYLIGYPTLGICYTIAKIRQEGESLLIIVYSITKITIYYTIYLLVESTTGIIITGRYIANKLFGKSG